MQLEIKKSKIEYQNPFELYSSLTRHGNIPALLMESRTQNLAYGRYSIIASNLALRVSGKNENLRIDALTGQGIELLDEISREDFTYAESFTVNSFDVRRPGVEPGKNRIELTYERKHKPDLDEEQRVKDNVASKFLRTLLEKFKVESNGNNFAGLYGAFAYDFARNFEDIGNSHQNEPGEDFTLFMPLDFYVFDDIKQTATRYQIQTQSEPTSSILTGHPFLSNDAASKLESMTEQEYIQKAASIINDIKNGRFMQCVLSRSIDVPLTENPLLSYARLREINPSPYCFFFNFGDGEFLYGSSPEIHAVVSHGEMKIRPLAGTIRRSSNPLEDALLRIKLQTDKKELSEHSMLVDLARNEVYRLCRPETVKVTDMFTVEQYPNLYHLASGVTGRLRPNMDSIDVLLTTIPAGTLSGAPKREAMKAIEELENSRRGFYGGAVGYLTFNGNCNTGITIRSVYVNNRFSRIQAGAGIVKDSVPENEAAEVRLKMQKPLENLEVRLK